MATVNPSKRTPGKYELRYMAEGKQHLRTFHSKKAADKARREIEHEIDMGIHAANADTVTFGEVARAFLIDCQRRQRIGDNMGEYTVHNYTNKIELYALPYLAETFFSDLNKSNRAFAKWIDELREHYAPEHSARRISDRLRRDVLCRLAGMDQAEYLAGRSAQEPAAPIQASEDPAPGGHPTP